MTKTVKVIQQVRQSATEAATHQHVHVAPGDVVPGVSAVRQGDIYLSSLIDRPHDIEVDAAPSRQLAPGTTPGSRHVVESLDGVAVYRYRQPTALQGPILDAPRAFTVTHPEHGWLTLPPGIWAVTYQRAYADELRRVVD